MMIATEAKKIRNGVMNETVVSLALFGWLSFGLAFAFGSTLALIVGIVFVIPAAATLLFGFAKDVRSWMKE